MTIPTFGEKEENVKYQNRYAAYLVIADAERDLLVLAQAPNGAFFLPGGEIEAGEDHLAALHREALEELGYEVTVGEYFGEAHEYFHSNHRKTDFFNPGYFYDTVSWQKVSAPLEQGSRHSWFPPEVAKEKLKRGSHKWAVEQWQEKYQK